MPEIILKLGDNIIHKYFFDKEILSVGRARDNDIVIENLSVSRNHARIRKVDGKFIITDLNSANGTFVNGVQITKTELVDNDVISIGKHKLQFINKPLTDEQIISDAFGADRTMIVDKTPNACLIVTKGRQKDQEFKISKYETSIGRSAENDIRLHDWFVSKKHATIIRQGQKFFIKDLGSWRGMKVAGKQIKEVELNDGDEIEFGTTTLVFRFSEEGEMAKGTGRVPKELGVDESAPQQYPQEEVSDEEIAEAIAGEELEEEYDQEPAEVKSKTEVEEDEPEISSIDELEELEEIEIKPEDDSSIEERLLEEEKESQEMIMGFERIEEEEEIIEGEEKSPEEELAKELETSEVEKRDKIEVAITDETAAPPSKHEESEKELVSAAPHISGEDQEKFADASDKLKQEILLWEHALTNKSIVIRKQAAKMLKKLTGKDYKYE